MAEAKKKKARVLVKCALGEIDDVVEIEVDQEKSLAGMVDTDPAAVKYAESLN